MGFMCGKAAVDVRDSDVVDQIKRIHMPLSVSADAGGYGGPAAAAPAAVDARGEDSASDAAGVGGGHATARDTSHLLTLLKRHFWRHGAPNLVALKCRCSPP
jgi:hypothetical protein